MPPVTRTPHALSLACTQALALALFLTACSPAGTEAAVASGQQETALEVHEPEPAPEPEPEPWSPAPFDPASPTVVLNDQETFFDAFWTNAKAQEKGEFETTAEHTERTSGASAFGPFRPDEIYAMQVAGKGHLEYDADMETFIPQYVLGCTNFSFLGIIKDHQLSCFVTKIVDSETTYPAQNAFGVDAEVTQEDGRLFHFIVSRHSKGIVAGNAVYADYSYRGRCPVPRDQAPSLKENLEMATLVTLQGPGMIKGIGSHTRPTVAKPVARNLDEFGVEAEIVGHACYDASNNALLYHELY